MKSLVLQHVYFMPRELEPGILYVSKEYSVAGHLCACGCGSKVVVPLGPAEWKFSERKGRPTLHPSIGSWQLPCRSHYLIIDGEIRWARPWSEKQIEAGKRADQQRREAYYAARQQGFWAWLWGAIRKLLG